VRWDRVKKGPTSEKTLRGPINYKGAELEGRGVTYIGPYTKKSEGLKNNRHRGSILGGKKER